MNAGGIESGMNGWCGGGGGMVVVECRVVDGSRLILEMMLVMMWIVIGVWCRAVHNKELCTGFLGLVMDEMGLVMV